MNWLQALNRRQDRSAELHTGACFRSSLRQGVVATAEVLGIAPDAYGIDHVRFLLKLEPAIYGWNDERTLTVASFLEHYPEPLGARAS